MRELIRTNDPVLLSYVRALLQDADIASVVLDENMSVLEGSLGVLPRRILVEEERLGHARRLLEDASLGEWISRKDETP